MNIIKLAQIDFFQDVQFFLQLVDINSSLVQFAIKVLRSHLLQYVALTNHGMNRD